MLFFGFFFCFFNVVLFLIPSTCFLTKTYSSSSPCFGILILGLRGSLFVPLLVLLPILAFFCQCWQSFLPLFCIVLERLTIKPYSPFSFSLQIINAVSRLQSLMYCKRISLFWGGFRFTSSFLVQMKKSPEYPTNKLNKVLLQIFFLVKYSL